MAEPETIVYSSECVLGQGDQTEQEAAADEETQEALATPEGYHPEILNAILDS